MKKSEDFAVEVELEIPAWTSESLLAQCSQSPRYLPPATESTYLAAGKETKDQTATKHNVSVHTNKVQRYLTTKVAWTSCLVAAFLLRTCPVLLMRDKVFQITPARIGHGMDNYLQQHSFPPLILSTISSHLFKI